MFRPALLAFAVLLAAPRLAFAATPPAAPPLVAPPRIVAAENFYADVARQIGGKDVAVTAILANPDEDPHLFETSPSVARALANAQITIANGAGYDPWMDKLLAASPRPGRVSIVVARLLGRKAGDNPHLWYDRAAMPALARALSAALIAADPAHAQDYRSRLTAFLDSLKPIDARIGALRTRFAGAPVTATEPVFGLMFKALGLQDRNQRFQYAVMNDTEPSASEIAHFEDDLRQHRVRLLLYNSQAADPIATRMREIAGRAGVPVVGATETEPASLRWQGWIGGELDAVSRALSSTH